VWRDTVFPQCLPHLWWTSLAGPHRLGLCVWRAPVTRGTCADRCGVGVAGASRLIELFVRVLVDGGLDGLMEEVVQVGLVARLTRLALGDDAQPLHAAAADIAGGAGLD
jgi:hypothetical protein